MKQAVFVDIQGTLGGTGWDDITELTLYSFSAEAIRLINSSGMLAIAITNQSHIGRGYISMNDYNNGVEKLQNELQESGAWLDAVYCCPHQGSDNCICKKPNTYLIEQARERFDIDVANSFVIGDIGMSDIIMAKNAGTKGILVLTGGGKGSLGEYRKTWEQYEADHVAENVLEAAKWVIASGCRNADGAESCQSNG